MSFAAFSRELIAVWRRRAGQIAVVREVDSTCRLARALVAENEQTMPPLDLLAWSQSAGRGRDDRRWQSPPGRGLYCTLIRPVDDRRRASTLPLAVAVALAGVINTLVEDRCRLKWPNDLLVEGRKLGGILIEALAGEGHGTVLISFGINVSGGGAEYGQPDDRATSLEQEGGDLTSMAELAAGVADAVDAELAKPPQIDLWTDAYRRLSLHREGDQLACRVGTETLFGTFLGFDEHGGLRLVAGGEERRLPAGELIDG